MKNTQNIRTITEQDTLIEKLWDEFTDIPMDPETEIIEEAFLHFPIGTPRMDIWHWFDKRYSKGVSYLLYKVDTSNSVLPLHIYDVVLTAQEYIELMTGFYFNLRDDNQLKEVETIINSEFGKNKYKNYSLNDIAKLVCSDKKFVLVEIVNINDNCEQEKIYCWFETPGNWNEDEFNKRLYDLWN